MGNVASHVSAIEAARMEENKRLNAEREILQALAPEKWKEMKAAFRQECADISEASHRFKFKCDDTAQMTFCISNVMRGLAMRLATFSFSPAVPRIAFEVHGHRPTSGTIDFIVSGSSVFFANGNSGVVLGEFVSTVMMLIVGNN